MLNVILKRLLGTDERKQSIEKKIDKIKNVTLSFALYCF